MRGIILISIFCCLFAIFSSCKSHISRIPDSVVKQDSILRTLCRENLDSNSQLSLTYALSELHIADSFSWAKGKAGAYNNIANAYLRLGDVPNAIEYYGKAEVINLRDSNMSQLASNYIGIAVLYDANQFTDTSYADTITNYFERAADIFKKIGNRKSEEALYHNLGIVNTKWRRYSKSEHYLQLALQLSLERYDSIAAANNYRLLGCCEYSNYNYEKAYYYYKIVSRFFPKKLTTIDSAQYLIDMALWYIYVPDSSLKKIEPTPINKYSIARIDLDKAHEITSIHTANDLLYSMYLGYYSLDTALKDCNGALRALEKMNGLENNEIGEKTLHKVIESAGRYAEIIRGLDEKRHHENKENHAYIIIMVFGFLLAVCFFLFLSRNNWLYHNVPNYISEFIGAFLIIGAISLIESVFWGYFVERSDLSIRSIVIIHLIVALILSALHPGVHDFIYIKLHRKKR